MRHWGIALFVCLIFGRSPVSQAQITYGSTNLDIDLDSGVVMATCETDVDNFTAEYYKTGVSCTIKDSNNKIIASEERTDDSAQGYVQVVLIVPGVPGETYTAMSSHLLDERYTVECANDPSQPLGVPYYDDVYDFSLLEGAAKTYNGFFELVSPHPGNIGPGSGPLRDHNCRPDHPENPKPSANPSQP
jgi:hypothetical protein